MRGGLIRAVRAAEAWTFWGSAKPDPTFPKPTQLDDSFVALDWFGPDGEGDAVSAALTGLQEAYILEQLEAFRSDTRGSLASVETTGVIMPRETRHRSNADMRLAATYVSGLPFKSQAIETDTAPKVAIRSDRPRDDLGGRVHRLAPALTLERGRRFVEK